MMLAPDTKNGLAAQKEPWKIKRLSGIPSRFCGHLLTGVPIYLLARPFEATWRFSSGRSSGLKS